MATKKKPKICNCLDKMNKALAPQNTEVDYLYFLTKGYALPKLSTSRIQNLRDGKKAVQVVPTYCPFCGKKYPDGS